MSLIIWTLELKVRKKKNLYSLCNLFDMKTYTGHFNGEFAVNHILEDLEGQFRLKCYQNREKLMFWVFFYAKIGVDFKNNFVSLYVENNC